MFRILLQNLDQQDGPFCLQFLSTDQSFTRLGLRAYRPIRIVILTDIFNIHMNIENNCFLVIVDFLNCNRGQIIKQSAN